MHPQNILGQTINAKQWDDLWYFCGKYVMTRTMQGRHEMSPIMVDDQGNYVVGLSIMLINDEEMTALSLTHFKLLAEECKNG